MTNIKLPTKLNLDWNNFEWEIATAFSVRGNRCVYRELYEEYKVNSIEQALDNLKKDKGILVHYQFFSPLLSLWILFGFLLSLPAG